MVVPMVIMAVTMVVPMGMDMAMVATPMEDTIPMVVTGTEDTLTVPTMDMDALSMVDTMVKQIPPDGAHLKLKTNERLINYTSF